MVTTIDLPNTLSPIEMKHLFGNKSVKVKVIHDKQGNHILVLEE